MRESPDSFKAILIDAIPAIIGYSHTTLVCIVNTDPEGPIIRGIYINISIVYGIGHCNIHSLLRYIICKADLAGTLCGIPY
mgnify:CR=1 FL=1